MGLTEKMRIHQASISELYGLMPEIPQRESMPNLFFEKCFIGNMTLILFD